MAIYKMVGEKERLEEVASTSFGQEGVLERSDLQRILRDQPEILEEGLFIITEEFSNWEGSGRSIDLLGLDSKGRLVVIELKRGDTGSHMDLQAIRYAAMVSTITLSQAIEAHQNYLNRRGIEGDAEEIINEHLENPESAGFSTERPRIILVSEGFHTELTTSILWLNQCGLDVTCIRMQPHRSGTELLVETSQSIPLPEAQDYLIKVREREEETERRQSAPAREFPGGDAFLESIEKALPELRERLKQLHSWAVSLEQEGSATLTTTVSHNVTLRLNVPGGSSLLSIVNQPKAVRILFQPGPFRNLAPMSMGKIDGLMDTRISTSSVSVGRNIPESFDGLLSALTDAYREANGKLAVAEDDADGAEQSRPTSPS